MYNFLEKDIFCAEIHAESAHVHEIMRFFAAGTLLNLLRTSFLSFEKTPLTRGVFVVTSEKTPLTRGVLKLP